MASGCSLKNHSVSVPAGTRVALGHQGNELGPPAVPIATPTPGQSGPRKCGRPPSGPDPERAGKAQRRGDLLPAWPCLGALSVCSGSCCCCCCRPRVRGDTAARRGRGKGPRRRARPGLGWPFRACGSDWGRPARSPDTTGLASAAAFGLRTVGRMRRRRRGPRVRPWAQEGGTGRRDARGPLGSGRGVQSLVPVLGRRDRGHQTSALAAGSGCSAQPFGRAKSRAASAEPGTVITAAAPSAGSASLRGRAVLAALLAVSWLLQTRRTLPCCLRTCPVIIPGSCSCSHS